MFAKVETFGVNTALRHQRSLCHFAGKSNCFGRFPNLTRFGSTARLRERRMRLFPAITLVVFLMTVASTGLAQTSAPVRQQPRTPPVLRSSATYSANRSQNADKEPSEVDEGSVVRVSTSLITAWKDGRKVPAVAALTKSALLFVLDRRTGAPIW